MIVLWKVAISLEKTINHITQVPAELFGLRDRGVLKEGTFADIVIFNPETQRGVFLMIFRGEGRYTQMLRNAQGICEWNSNSC